MASTFWTCPSCRRRVPPSVRECRCGYTRALAERLQGQAPGGRPWDVIGLVLVFVVVVALAVVQLVRPWKPRPIHPLLGYWDNSPVQPAKAVKKPAPPHR